MRRCASKTRKSFAIVAPVMFAKHLALSFVVLCFFSSTPFATVREIPHEYPTILSGIEVSEHGDTLLLAPGTYSGDGNRDLVLEGKCVNIFSEAGADVTIIDLADSDTLVTHRALTVIDSINPAPEIRGITFVNGTGLVDGLWEENTAGVIYVDHSSLRVDSCNFEYNQAEKWGGCIFADGGHVVVSDSWFAYNYAGDGGTIGAVYDSEIELYSCTFTLNEAWQGGTIRSFESTMRINNCEFTNCSADPGSGGAIFGYASWLYCNYSDFRNNYSKNGGGAISLDQSFALQMRGCNLTGNESVGAGALYMGFEGYFFIQDCVIAENRIGGGVNDHKGAGMFLRHVGGIMSNCTFSNNMGADLGAHVWVWDDSDPTTFINCQFTFAPRWSAAISPFDSTNPPTFRNCNIFGNISGNWTGNFASQLGQNGNISENPLYCNPALLDFSVTDNSPCLPENNSTGILIGAAGKGCDSHSDILRVSADGSGEYQNIQEAIDSSHHFDTIMLEEGTYRGPGNTDIDYSGKLVVLTSEGDAENTVIDCEADQYNFHRGMYFNRVEDERAVVDGITIMNGYTQDGSAIFMDFWTSPTIRNCIFKDNTASYYGGAILMQLAWPLIETCTFTGNSGVGHHVATIDVDSAVFRDCTFLRNHPPNTGLPGVCRFSIKWTY